MGRKVGLPHFPQFAMALPQAHAAVWVLLAAALAYYGNGESDLLSLVLWDSRLNRLVKVLQHGCRPWAAVRSTVPALQLQHLPVHCTGSL